MTPGPRARLASPAFATQYAVDDSEVARLKDIQGNDIRSYGKKIVDVEFLGDGSAQSVPDP